MADIFLSYSRSDQRLASQVAERLRANRWSVFQDRESIPAGEEWPAVLRAELERAHCVVVLWSPTAVMSKWVNEEAKKGRERGVLVPARLLLVDIPKGYRKYQTVDLAGPGAELDPKGLDLLVGSIRKLIGSHADITLEPLKTFLVTGERARHTEI